MQSGGILRQTTIVPMSTTVKSTAPKDAVSYRPISPTELQAHKANTQTSSTTVERTGWKLGLKTTTTEKPLGSKEQIDLLKAKIDSVKFSASDSLSTSNPLSQSPPSTLATVGSYAKKFGTGLFRTLETITVLPLLVDKGARKDLKAFMGMIKDSWNSAIDNSDAAVGNSYIKTGSAMLTEADGLEQQVKRIATSPEAEFGLRQELGDAMHMRDTLKAMLVTQQSDLGQLQQALAGQPDSSELQSRVKEKQQLIEATTNQLTEPESIISHVEGHLTQVDSLRQQAAKLREQGQNAVALGQSIKGNVSEVVTKYAGYPAMVTGTTAKAALSATQAGTGLAKGAGVEMSLEVGAKALGISAKTLQLVGVVGAGVSAAVDSYDFYQTSKSHNKDLNKIEMAEALLTDQPGREKMAAKLDAEAARLEQGGFKGSMAKLGAKLNPFADRSNPVTLRNKAIAIRGIDPRLSPETLDPKVKAIVTQIKEHSDISKKRWAMAKNIVGIAGAALTIAALTIACPPAGLVVAACVIGVAAGGAGLLMSYNNWSTSSQRFINVTDLRKSLDQIDIKQGVITQNIKTMEATPTFRAHQETLAACERDEKAGVPMTPDRLEAKQTAQAAVAQRDVLKNQLTALDSLRTEATLNLLAASPDEAASLIYRKAMDHDPTMQYLAKSVMGVDYDHLPESVAVDAIARGMHIDVYK